MLAFRVPPTMNIPTPIPAIINSKASAAIIRVSFSVNPDIINGITEKIHKQVAIML